MKSIFFILSLTLISLSTQPNLQKENIDVRFDANTSFDQLVEVRDEMSQQGITLIYSRIVFNEYGSLSELAFEVKTNDGFAGTASSHNISLKKGLGFYLHYDDDEGFGTYSER